ncbi:MAG: tetratricopeptide repeat protein [Chitinophagales bacterium]
MIYHNITARNNAYFNATELLKETQRSLETSHQDDYDEILAVYPDQIPEEAETYSGTFDEVIKKCSRAIKMHEPSKFSDNSYLLVGFSYYMKGDFETALETLQFLSTEFKETPQSKSSKKKKKKKKSKKKKRKSKKPMTAAQKEELEEEVIEEEIEEIKEEKKKEEEDWDGKKSFKEILTHQFSRPEAMVLMVNIYAAMEKYKEAETVLTVIEGEENFPGYLANDVAKAKADLYITTNNLERAIPPLKVLDENIKRKKKKIRYLYIMAQIYERIKDYTNAVEKYKEVLSARPDYKMEFNAKMSLARIAGGDGSSYSEIKKLLAKLLKDSKNEEFYDQIYYALAELELSQNNREKAIEYLSKSIESSMGNTKQLAKSHLKQGELYYSDKEYVKAQPGYENAGANIDEEHPKKQEIEKRDNALQNLVKQINIIEEKDSLLVLANLPEDELDKRIEAEVSKIEAEIDKANQSQPAAMLNRNTSGRDSGGGSSGSWYFYNTGSKSRGYNEFVQRWGKRELEDNWRRSNKESSGSLEEVAGQAEEEGIEEEFDYLAVKEQLLATIPRDEAEKQKAEKEVVEAYFELGNIYKSEIENLPKAIETFETLLEKYPNNNYLVEVYYNLHLLYKEINNNSKAEQYKNLVLDEYPNSKFAKILLDPNYLDKQKDNKEEVDRYYENVYAHFTSGNYRQVLLASAQADSLFETNHLAPKFALLSAISRAKTDSLGAYIDALKELQEKYPGTLEAEKAEEMLTILEESENKVYEKEINIREYTREMDALHYVLVVYNSNNIKSTDLSLAISRFNEQKSSLEKLKTNTLILSPEQSIIVIKYFEGEKKVRNYFNSIKKEEEAFKNFPDNSLSFYFITDINFNKVVINREINSYLEFFEKNYKD